MTTSIDILKVRRRLIDWNAGVRHWQIMEPFGSDGWRLHERTPETPFDHPLGEIILTCAPWGDDNVEYLHASMVRPAPMMPSYDDLRMLHHAVWGTTGYAYQLFVPESSHVNIHHGALHLWGRLDGKPLMIDPGAVLGSI